MKSKILTITLAALMVVTMSIPVFAGEKKMAKDTNVKSVNNLNDYIKETNNKTGPAYVEIDTKTGTVMKNDKAKSFKSEFGKDFSKVKGNKKEIKKEIEKKYSVTDENNEKIEAANIFGSRKLTLKTNKNNIISDNAEKGVYYDGKYTFVYQDEKATEDAFVDLAKHYGAGNVYIDYPIKTNAAKTIDYKGPIGWGYNYMNFGAALDEDFTNGKTRQPIKVAVIDSGIKSDHPIFKDRDIFIKSFLSRTEETTDYANHGTGTTGIIAESTPSNVSFMALRAIDSNGSGFISDSENAIKFAVDNNADVINLSVGYNISKNIKENREYWGKYNISYTKEDENRYIEARKAPLKNAYDHGVFIVAAAGNDNIDIDSNMFYPAASPQVVSVGAVDQNGERASFSNYGKTLDFAAPGVDVKIASAWSPYYKEKANGTSFSAPYITAAAANINSLDKNMSNTAIKNKLIAIANKTRTNYYGYGVPKFKGEVYTGTVTVKGTNNSNFANLSWGKESNAVKYIIQTSVDKKNWTNIATVTNYSYKLTGLDNGKALYVRIIPSKETKKSSVPSNIILVHGKLKYTVKDSKGKVMAYKLGSNYYTSANVLAVGKITITAKVTKQRGLMQSASSSSKKLCTISANKTVTVISQGATWDKVQYKLGSKTYTGYIENKYLK